MRLRATGSCGVASQQLVSRVENEDLSSQREGGVRLRAIGSCGVASQQLVSRVENEDLSSQREGKGYRLGHNRPGPSGHVVPLTSLTFGWKTMNNPLLLNVMFLIHAMTVTVVSFLSYTLQRMGEDLHTIVTSLSLF